MTSIELPDPVIMTDYKYETGRWEGPGTKYVGLVLINGNVVFFGPPNEDSRLAEDRALDAFALKIKELIGG